MLVSRAASRAHHLSQTRCLRNFSSSAAVRKLQLAYDLHEPPKDAVVEHGPIVFMHGLFGSKKNNRSMSK